LRSLGVILHWWLLGLLAISWLRAGRGRGTGLSLRTRTRLTLLLLVLLLGWVTIRSNIRISIMIKVRVGVLLIIGWEVVHWISSIRRVHLGNDGWVIRTYYRCWCLTNMKIFDVCSSENDVVINFV